MGDAKQTQPVSSKDDGQPIRPKRGVRKKFLIGLGLLFALPLGFTAVQSWRASTQNVRISAVSTFPR